MDDDDGHDNIETGTNGLATVEDLKEVWESGDLSNGSISTIIHVLESYSAARRFPALHDVLFQSIKECSKTIELPEVILATYAQCILDQTIGQLVDLWSKFLKWKKRYRSWFQLFATFLKHFKVPGDTSSIPSRTVVKLNKCILDTRTKLSEKLESDLRGCKNDWIMICFYFGELLIILLQDSPSDHSTADSGAHSKDGKSDSGAHSKGGKSECDTFDESKLGESESKGRKGKSDLNLDMSDSMAIDTVGSKSWYDHSYLGVEYSWKDFHSQLASYKDKYGMEHSLNFLLQKLRFLEIVSLNRISDEILLHQIEEKKKEIVTQIFVWIRQHYQNNLDQQFEKSENILAENLDNSENNLNPNFENIPTSENILSQNVVEKILPYLDSLQMKELSQVCAFSEYSENSPISVSLRNNQVFQSVMISAVSEHIHNISGAKIFSELYWNGSKMLAFNPDINLLSGTVCEVHKVVLKPDSFLAKSINKFFKTWPKGKNSKKLKNIDAKNVDAKWTEADIRPLLNLTRSIALGCLSPLNQTRVLLLLFTALFKTETPIQASLIGAIISVLDGFRAIWFFGVVDPSILIRKVIECVQAPSGVNSSLASEANPGASDLKKWPESIKPSDRETILLKTFFNRIIQRVLKEDLLSVELVDIILISSGPCHVLFLSTLTQCIKDNQGQKELVKKIAKSLSGTLHSSANHSDANDFGANQDRLEILTAILESGAKKVIRKNLETINSSIHESLLGGAYLELSVQIFLASAFKKRSLLGLDEEFVSNIYCKLIGLGDGPLVEEPPKKKRKKKRVMVGSLESLKENFPSLLAAQVITSSSEAELELFERLIIGRLSDEDCSKVSKYQTLQMASMYSNYAKNIRSFLVNMIQTIFETLSSPPGGDSMNDSSVEDGAKSEIDAEIQLLTLELLQSAIERHQLETSDLKLFFEMSLLSLQSLMTSIDNVSKFCSFFSILDRIIRTVIQKHKYCASVPGSLLISTVIARMLKLLMKVSEEKRYQKYQAIQVKKLVSIAQNLDRTICLFCSNRNSPNFSTEFIATFIIESQSIKVSKMIRQPLQSLLLRVVKTIDNGDKMNELEIIFARFNQNGKQFLRNFLTDYDKNYKYRGLV